MTNTEKFIAAVEREIDNYVCTSLMDKIEHLAQKNGLHDDEVMDILQSQGFDLGELTEAWEEYTE